MLSYVFSILFLATDVSAFVPFCPAQLRHVDSEKSYDSFSLPLYNICSQDNWAWRLAGIFECFSDMISYRGPSSEPIVCLLNNRPIGHRGDRDGNQTFTNHDKCCTTHKNKIIKSITES